MELTLAKGRATFTGDDAVKFGYLKGEAKWAHILKANEFGNFGIDLYEGDPGFADLVAELEDMQDTAFKLVEKEGKKPIKADITKFDEETGKRFINFKLPEVDWEGKPNSIQVYDIHGKLIEDFDTLIGNGSVVKIKYRAKPYFMGSTKMVGISYRFYAVQIIDLVPYSGGGGGFSDESDGTAPFDDGSTGGGSDY